MRTHAPIPEEAEQAILSGIIAAQGGQQNPDILKDLRAMINTLNKAKSVLLEEIKGRFPKYADFTDPEPVTFSVIQKHLRPLVTSGLFDK